MFFFGTQLASDGVFGSKKPELTVTSMSVILVELNQPSDWLILIFFLDII